MNKSASLRSASVLERQAAVDGGQKDIKTKAATIAENGGNQRLPPSRGRTQTTRENTTATFEFVSILLAFSPFLGELPP
jgi:hypothetical protein